MSGSESKDHVPYIFVLDLDGTVVGRVDFQSHRFSMQQTMRKHGYKVASPAPPKAFRPGNGLVRPGLSAFMTAMRQFYGNVVFFVYTASEKQWALQEVAWMEQAHGIRFQRPIFTRADCIVDAGGSYRKSIRHIAPRMVRAVSKSRPLTKKEKEMMLERRLLIIDNNAVYVDRQDRLLLCPDYNYISFENLLDGFPAKALSHPAVQQQVLSLMNEGLVCPPPEGSDAMARQLREYHWLLSKCKAVVEANREFEGDEFWKILRKLILRNRIRDFTRSVVQQLQALVWRRYKTSAAASS
jgi:hypothetical protein